MNTMDITLRKLRGFVLKHPGLRDRRGKFFVIVVAQSGVGTPHGQQTDRPTSRRFIDIAPSAANRECGHEEHEDPYSGHEGHDGHYSP
jgi:hypothetical protein